MTESQNRMMATALDTQVQTMPAATLAPIVQQALKRDAATPTQWTVELFRGNRGGGMSPATIYRFMGSAQDQGETLPWSLILKVLTEPQEGDPPEWLSSWRREVDFYRSELAQSLSGLRTACYSVKEQTDTTGRVSYWLWLEDLTTNADTHWSLQDYHLVARHLGQFNGAFLGDLPLPSATWLSMTGTRGYVEAAAPWVTRLQENQDHPLVRPAYPPAAVESFLQLWQDRELYLNTLDRLPQTLCHRDAQRSNLFLRVDAAGYSEMVAIDWSSVGLGNIGLDINQLIVFHLFAVAVDTSEAAMLDQAIFAGYLDGLRDAGWRGDPAWVRLGYTASTIRGRTTGIFRYLQYALDEDRLRQLKQMWQARGHTIDEATEQVQQVDLFLSGLVREASDLRERLL
jgi:hypothetical protein